MVGPRLLLFGPPGAGKGTHAKRLARDLGVPHIATGEMLRTAIEQGSESGRQAEAFIRRGELVPDQLVTSMLKDRLRREDARGGYLLDGFPRTVPQAQAMAADLAELGERLDGVLSMDAPWDVLIKRIAGRFTCGRCQAVFNQFFRIPKQPGLCDECGGPLIQRVDDQEQAARLRLAEYEAKTSPVLAFFSAQGVPIWTVLSTDVVDEVYAHIRKVVARIGQASGNDGRN